MVHGADGRWRPEAPTAPSSENFFQEFSVARCISLVRLVCRWDPLGTVAYPF
jgi:hypothetical protein